MGAQAYIAKLKEYIEAEKNGQSTGGVSQPQQPSLPDLSAKEKRDMGMLRAGKTTEEDLLKKLKRGNVMAGEKGMSSDEAQAYIAKLKEYIEAEKNGQSTGGVSQPQQP